MLWDLARVDIDGLRVARPAHQVLYLPAPSPMAQDGENLAGGRDRPPTAEAWRARSSRRIEVVECLG